MRKQSGFTLIELLLVLAIIGIISAIALPAMLSQRARSRDRNAVMGSIGRIGDILGHYDMAKGARDEGSTISVEDALNAWLPTSFSLKDKNPWATTDAPLIFSSAVNFTAITATTAKTDFENRMVEEGAGQPLGQGCCYIQMPAAALPGFLGVAVKLNARESDTNVVVVKSVGIE